ncbi:MAG: arginine deiminase-related protein [Chloroflexota bacterium]
MDNKSEINKNAATKQWESLYAAYENAGAEISIVDPVEGIPELTFAGDSIFLFGDIAISSKFRYAERQPEVQPMANWFTALGYSIKQVSPNAHFEGNAELIKWNGNLIGGYGIRSSKKAYPSISETLDIEIIPLQMKNPYYHLDTGFCPLGEDTIAYVPEAFEEESRKTVSGLASKTIEINSKEAQVMACNSKMVGDTVIVSTKQAPKFCSELRALGFDVIELELSEFRKAGAGAKCLTLEAY